MDENISSASTISLVESEPSVNQEDFVEKRFSINSRKISTHNYNTRNSVKLRKLYVDLNSCRIEPGILADFSDRRREEDFEVNPSLICNQLSRRDSDTFSEDSTQLDTNNNYFIDPLSTRFLMDEQRICGQTNWNTWKKYGYAFYALAILYIYLQVIHTGENVRKLHKEIDTLRTDVRSTKSTNNMKKLENILKDMKREREQNSRSIESIVTMEMDKFYADKTGRTDFALEATGGKIVTLIPGTENFDNAKTLFGLTLCEGIHGPRAMLRADMSPGHCWAFKGSHGGAVIKLLGKVQINAVSLEHISESVSPTGEISSAPKEFTVVGMNSSSDRGDQLGTFIYQKYGPLVQTFSIENTKYYDHVEFRVISNQGNLEYTCVYRFRVHGVLERDKEF